MGTSDRSSFQNYQHHIIPCVSLKVTIIWYGLAITTHHARLWLINRWKDNWAVGLQWQPGQQVKTQTRSAEGRTNQSGQHQQPCTSTAGMYRERRKERLPEQTSPAGTHTSCKDS
eukprot:scaffold36146_cov16-Tisochrysis_lutea.AAC.1